MADITLNLPEALVNVLRNADHIDVKMITARVDMRTFVAGFMSYMPAWVRVLYALRWAFVRLLGLRQDGVPGVAVLRPEAVPMRAGEPMAFFTVEAAQEDEFWLVSAHESHLSARLCVVAQPQTADYVQYRVYTVVAYHRWIGRLYFNVIRPFHHWVVGGMLRAGARA
jgi:hypothetical protein